MSNEKPINRRQMITLLSAFFLPSMTAKARSFIALDSLLLNTQDQQRRDQFFLCSITCKFPARMSWDEFLHHQRQMEKLDEFLSLNSESKARGDLLGWDYKFQEIDMTWNYLFPNDTDYFHWDEQRKNRCPVKYSDYMKSAFKYSGVSKKVSRDDLTKAGLDHLIYGYAGW